MRRERRQLTKAELASITSRRPVVVRKIQPEKKPQSPGPGEAAPDRGDRAEGGVG